MKKRVLFISSTGGHLSELLQLSPLFEKYDYHIITEKDNATKNAKEKYGDRISYLPYGTRKKLFRFVLPSIVMMIFTSIYSVVDGLFVSNFVGKTAFASVNLIMPLLM